MFLTGGLNVDVRVMILWRFDLFSGTDTPKTGTDTELVLVFLMHKQRL